MLSKVKPRNNRPLCPSGLLTPTSTVIGKWAGVVQVIWLELATVTLSATAPPKVTVAPALEIAAGNGYRGAPVSGPRVGVTVVIMGRSTTAT